MAFFTVISAGGAVWLAAGIVMLFFRRTRAVGIILIAAIAIGYLTGDWIIKPLVQRPRPFVTNPDFELFVLKVPSGYSFPSGHSAAAAAATTVLFTKLGKWGFAALPVAFCIVFSRLYNYVHFPSDVICGIILGIISAFLVMWIAKKTKLEYRLSRPKNKQEGSV